jgi:hypothetical protein
MMAAPNDVASLGTGKGTLAAVDQFATPNSVPKLRCHFSLGAGRKVTARTVR